MTRRPLLAIDLFCCAGGVSMGLHRAGFKVIGIDHNPQPRYPFKFIQADAIEYLNRNGDRDDVSLWWASPPCQGYSRSTLCFRMRGRKYPDLVAATRDGLERTKKPFVIENVEGAPLRDWFMLCGRMFGLGVLRHRWFESNISINPPLHFKHGTWGTMDRGRGHYVTVAGNGRGVKDGATKAMWSKAMGIDWMTRKELTQAIPPSYSEYIGRAVLAKLRESAGSAGVSRHVESAVATDRMQVSL